MRPRAYVHRWLLAGVLGALGAFSTAPVFAAHKPVSSSQPTSASNERLVEEFSPLVGNNADTEALITSLRTGHATQTEGAASVDPATGPLGYGEVRLALKVAQGALAQQGITHPDGNQLRAALHGGVLKTEAGEQTLPGVLPLKSQGTGWATMAESYGVTALDMLPPPPKPGEHRASSSRHGHKHHGKASKGRGKKGGAKEKGHAKGKGHGKEAKSSGKHHKKAHK